MAACRHSFVGSLQLPSSVWSFYFCNRRDPMDGATVLHLHSPVALVTRSVTSTNSLFFLRWMPECEHARECGAREAPCCSSSSPNSQRYGVDCLNETSIVIIIRYRVAGRTFSLYIPYPPEEALNSSYMLALFTYFFFSFD